MLLTTFCLVEKHPRPSIYIGLYPYLKKKKKKDERECSLFSVFFFLFCDYQTQVRYWYSVLDFQMKFSRTQDQSTIQAFRKGPYCTVYMMKLRLGICLSELDFTSNLERLIHLHIQVIYEYADWGSVHLDIFPICLLCSCKEH